MQRFQNILVGVDLSSGDRFAADDLSESTQEAIHQALVLGSALKAKLTFFAAADLCQQTEELLEADSSHIWRNVDDDVLAVLEHIKQRADERGIEAEIGFAHGSGWEQIIRKIVRDNHDLVIIGTRAHTAIGRTLFGTTATKLLRYAPCPVWVTKPGLKEEEALDVLVADDLGDVGFRCLQLAISGGQYFATRTYVLHVIEEQSGGWFHSNVDQEKLAEYREKKKAEVEQQLEERLSSLDYRTLQLGVQTFVEFGAPDQHILKMIEEHGIDVVIMGTKARTGIGGMFVGNTAERLLPHLPCSLLAVKPADFECHIKG
ncbi:MAG: universal stress protein [Planctomycetes bacterium]|nr:universal stress protein [Planctomycetota bacterium]